MVQSCFCAGEGLPCFMLSHQKSTKTTNGLVLFMFLLYFSAPDGKKPHEPRPGNGVNIFGGLSSMFLLYFSTWGYRMRTSHGRESASTILSGFSSIVFGLVHLLFESDAAR